MRFVNCIVVVLLLSVSSALDAAPFATSDANVTADPSTEGLSP